VTVLLNGVNTIMELTVGVVAAIINVLIFFCIYH
jgi:hypothetical protein